MGLGASGIILHWMEAGKEGWGHRAHTGGDGSFRQEQGHEGRPYLWKEGRNGRGEK